jgi:hypothetical protein
LVIENVDFEFAFKHTLGHTGYVVAEARLEGLFWVEWGGLTFSP